MRTHTCSIVNLSSTTSFERDSAAWTIDLTCCRSGSEFENAFQPSANGLLALNLHETRNVEVCMTLGTHLRSSCFQAVPQSLERRRGHSYCGTFVDIGTQVVCSTLHIRKCKQSRLDIDRQDTSGRKQNKTQNVHKNAECRSTAENVNDNSNAILPFPTNSSRSTCCWRCWAPCDNTAPSSATSCATFVCIGN